MKVKIKFYSNWAIGSGKGGDSKDSIILNDDNGLPFIPGKTLKGLIRDAFLECNYSKEDAIRLFGQEKNLDIKTDDLEEGILRFNSAYLSDAFISLPKDIKAKLFTSKTATRLDEKKQAIDYSLRKNEVCIPLELHTTILVKENNSELVEDNYKKIEKALKMLKIMGEKRHRGLGRCLITVPEFDTIVINNTDTTEKSKTSKVTVTANTIRFKCKVTESLVLVKKAKTGQNIESLDYIPGNTFRGIVAGAIFNGDTNEFNDIIFNKTVQFGDAHLLIDGERSLKTPFSFYYDKNKDNNTLYNFHHLKDNDWIDKKLKSRKNGYLIGTEDGFKIKNIEYGNRIKSSRDRKKRSSEKGGMFSYHYIKKGQEFEFEVRSENSEYLTKIIEILDNKTKYFGKSKSAEFGGAIEIKFMKEVADQTITKNGKYLYAESNLCFLNEYGEFTATPSIKDLTEDENAVIDWEKSQVKFRTFAPYNFHRKNYDFERLIIEKGSVFVFEKEVDFNEVTLKKGLGCFLTEGYGKVLISPSFLKDKEVKTIPKDTTEKNKQETTSKDATEEDKTLIQFIKSKHKKNLTEIGIDNKVKEYITKNYFQKKPSQWARVFNATTQAKDTTELEGLLFGNEDDTIYTKDKSIFYGGSKNWNKSDIAKITTFFKEDIIKDKKIVALRKLAKKMIHKTKNSK
ncbi:hypothetical protein Lupro_02525 [Lutibacter profundi]|uniref:CRISPR type III-associated protein domain-containing protein n=1 Tax=Lutibacter profundi TaxID=1622118 RepID=A0A120IE09_9FLAO|nr:RAMP superfamily CRISPR-associated protein [Lutibacter profundi]AMC10194.1 hypothetical protein Lupro_02525 [Lutibacter profundi]